MDREPLTALRESIDMTPAAPDSIIMAEEQPEPLEPKPAVAHTRWIRPLADYERRETTVVEGQRYG
jgi:hypothetical protein